VPLTAVGGRFSAYSHPQFVGIYEGTPPPLPLQGLVRDTMAISLLDPVLKRLN
jgi:hypothetical protein